MSQVKPTNHYFERIIAFGPLALGVLLLLVIGLFLARRPDIHPDLFFADLGDFTDRQYHQSYIGLMSQLGLVFWFSGASFVGLAALLSLNSPRITPRHRQYLFGIAFAGFYLGLDDALLLHEHLFPVYLGIDERITITLYGLIFPLAFIYFRREIRQHQFVYFLLFIGLMGLSFGVDFLRPDDGPILTSIPVVTFVEDGAKFLGLIAFWTYCLRLSYEVVSTQVWRQQTKA